jgi:hypothetical protein
MRCIEPRRVLSSPSIHVQRTAQTQPVAGFRPTERQGIGDELPGCCCRRPLGRSWWHGMRQWTAEATAWSLAIIPLHSSAGLPDAVRRLRRNPRDVRDRLARRSKQWHDVCSDGMALMLVIHEGINRREVEDALHRRWPDLVLKSPEQEEPTVAMSPIDAADLRQCRRGVEPLRIVIMPQQDQQATTLPVFGPMQIVG